MIVSTAQRIDGGQRENKGLQQGRVTTTNLLDVLQDLRKAVLLLHLSGEMRHTEVQSLPLLPLDLFVYHHNSFALHSSTSSSGSHKMGNPDMLVAASDFAADRHVRRNQVRE